MTRLLTRCSEPFFSQATGSSIQPRGSGGGRSHFRKLGAGQVVQQAGHCCGSGGCAEPVADAGKRSGYPRWYNFFVSASFSECCFVCRFWIGTSISHGGIPTKTAVVETKYAIERPVLLRTNHLYVDSSEALQRSVWSLRASYDYSSLLALQTVFHTGCQGRQVAYCRFWTKRVGGVVTG